VLTLVQCGETEWSREGRLHGSTNLPLSAAGQASVTTDVGHFAGGTCTTIYHPADDAASETARIIADAINAKTRAVEDFADPDLGLLEGLLEQDLSERYPKRYKQWQDDPLSLLPPEGEAFSQARSRIFKAVAKVLKKSRNEEIGMVLHPLGLGFVRCWLAERPASDLWVLASERQRVEHHVISTEQLEQLRASAKTEPVNP
jgi:probable phosphoglycerate mutase